MFAGGERLSYKQLRGRFDSCPAYKVVLAGSAPATGLFAKLDSKALDASASGAFLLADG